MLEELQESTGITADKMPKGGKSHYPTFPRVCFAVLISLRQP